MRIYTSYFYQIRHFPPDLVPLSTAVWAPKWFKKNNRQYKDSRGVINGIEARIFAPIDSHCLQCTNDMKVTIAGDNCPFKYFYRKQLDALDFCWVWGKFIELAKRIKEKEGFDPDFALMLHEAPGNICSERSVIQDWFKDNGNPIWEWDYDTMSRDELIAKLKQQTT